MGFILKRFVCVASASALAAVAACSGGGTLTDGGDSAVPRDGAGQETGGPSDGSMNDGASVGPDGSELDATMPPGDGSTPPMDGAIPTDGTVPVDVVVPADAMLQPDAPPGSCGISADVAAHVTAMSTMGWGALNRSRGILMHGCAGASRPQDCLATVPLADDTTIGAMSSAVAGAHLRVFFTSTNRSSYWTRSSADGRFVGRGTHVRDLARGVEVEAMGAMYDPAFFPDNSGFAYQPGGRLCPQSVLTTGMPSSIAITGAGSMCVGSSVGLYEHLGAALGGTDYWATSAGTAAWDDGGHAATLTETPRNEAWGMTAQTTLTLMANTGAGFMGVGQRTVATPFQGDAVISPSSRLLVTRFVNTAGVYQGFVLHQLNATHAGAAITATTREIARYCTVGAKPGFSFDERYIVYHHYIGGGPTADADARELGFTGASDAGFAGYRSMGGANVYLLDLVTGVRTRVTTLAPGRYALYPHFRSDGWIYFIVRTLGQTREHIVASDAALLM
jgi:hypothetical protein